MAKNVYKTYSNASALSRTEGIIWYREANLLALEIAEEFNMSLAQTSLIIAALSTRNSWGKNKKDAYEFVNRISNYYTTFPGMMRACTNKCVSIYYDNNLKSKDSDTCDSSFIWETNPFNTSSVLGSKSYKTKAFARTIYNFENPYSSCVVIDTHAINIANGYWQITGKTHNEVFSNWEKYELYSDAYKVAAEWLETPAHVVQAVTWCAWRKQLSNYRKAYYESKKNCN